MKTAVTEAPEIRQGRRHETVKDVRPHEQQEGPAEQTSPSAPIEDQSTLQQSEVLKDEDLSAETLLQRLLVTTERLAQRAELGRRKWQAIALLAITFAVTVTALTIWTYTESISFRTSHASLLLQNHDLASDLDSARAAAADLTRNVDLLTDQNIRLISENSRLKTQDVPSQPVAVKQAQPPAKTPTMEKPQSPAAVKPRPIKAQTEPARLEQDRLNSIRRGNYPRDMTRSELVAVLGEPDRTYHMGQYEQLLYFDKAPGRFWFSRAQRLYAAR